MRKIILLFFVSLLLAACQKGEVDVKPEEFVDTRPMYESNAKPRELELRQDAYAHFYSEVGYYCWAKESVEECPSELPDVQKKKLNTIREQISPIGYPIDLYFETYIESPLPLPDSAELFIYKEDTYTPVEISNNKFLVPEEEGVYTYIYKTIFDGENKGVAFYIFKLRARYIEIEEED